MSNAILYIIDFVIKTNIRHSVRCFQMFHENEINLTIDMFDRTFHPPHVWHGFKTSKHRSSSLLIYTFYLSSDKKCKPISIDKISNILIFTRIKHLEVCFL